MGGSGGGVPESIPPSIGDLEEIARIEMREEKAPPPRRRVFLSFRHVDLDEVNLFRGQAKDENQELDFIDFSLKVPFDSENAEYIRSGIRERIRNSSVTVVLIGEDAHESVWVDWEIRESVRLEKGVVAVNLREGVKTPAALKENGIEPIPWNQKMINQAIQDSAEE